jgi:hypothetical protein
VANAAVTGDVFVLSRAQLGYGLGGLLVSPGRGLLLFAPIAIVAVAYAFRTRTDRAIAGALVAQLVVIAFFHMVRRHLLRAALRRSGLVAIWLASTQPIRTALLAPALAITALVGTLGLFLWRAEQWETLSQP